MSKVRPRRQMVPALGPKVQALEPRALLATFQVTNSGDAGAGTLRDAINQANASGGSDTITFAIGTGAQSIALVSPLPAITDTLTIDGGTQPGYAGKPIIELNGAGAGSGAHGLLLKAPATIKGLVINRFSGRGIFFQNSSGSSVKNCYIGTNLAGNAAAANNDDGIYIETANNVTIGGPAASDRNIISGNSAKGIHFLFTGTSSTFLIENNYIGLDATGSFKIANGASGIDFFARATNNVMRNNVISGNGGHGITFFGGDATDNTIVGNKIGTNAAGTIAIANGGNGVDIFGPSRITIQDNLISGNSGTGITLAGGDFITITGNTIGTDVNRLNPLGNLGEGISIAKLGGDFNNIRIGGLDPADGNVIAHNGATFTRPGIAVGSSAQGVLILSNSIYNNASIGIDLNSNGAVDLNDAGDPDTGGNGLQNFPVLTSVVTGNGQLTVSGTLNSAASTTYVIQVFASPVADSSGFGEGRTMIGSFNVTTDAAGNAAFTRTLTASVSIGDKLSATATAPATAAILGATSEFSQVLNATGAPSADLNALLSAEAMITAGNTITYNARARNNGPGQVSGVQLSLTLPAGAILVSAVPAGYSVNNGVLTFDFGTLNANASSLAVVTVRVETPGNAVATATVSGGGLFSDPDPINNLASATTFVDDRPGTFGLVIPSQNTVEASGFVTVGVVRTNGAKGAVTVNYAISPGTATPGLDYNVVGDASGTISFADGQTFASVLIEILPDGLSEGDETISVVLSSPTGGTSLGSGATGGVTILDDEPLPTVSIADLTLDESDATATFVVSLSGPSSRTANFTYITAGGNATAGADYLGTGGTVVFAPGELSKTITVDLLNDDLDELDETFQLLLSIPSNLTLPAVAPRVTLIDEDASPTVAITPTLSVTEGTGQATSGTLTLTLSGPSGREVTVRYATVAGSALSGSDFNFASGVVTFTPGVVTRTVALAILGDSSQEAAETFLVELSQPSGAVISGSTAEVTILDNDPPPQLAITPASVTEPDDGTAVAVFNVRLSTPSGLTVTVRVSTADLSAVAGKDYNSTSTQLTFAPGETQKTFNVLVKGDRVHEASETFRAVLSSPGNAVLSSTQAQATAAIVNNDPAPTVGLVADVRLTEGDTGSAEARFSLALSAPSELPVTVKVATADVTARAGEDYTPRNLTVTIAPGQTSAVFAVPVLGDRHLDAAEEVFRVNLSNPAGATIAVGKGSAVGRIVENDKVGSFQFEAANYTVAENVNGGFVDVVVVRTGGVAGVVSIPFTTANGTATGGRDFRITSGVVTFAEGQTRANIRIVLANDTLVEPDETFVVNLGQPNLGATLGAIRSTRVVIRSEDRPPPAPRLLRATPRFSGANLTSIELAFSGDLNPAAATNLASYALKAAGRDKVLGTSDDVALPLLRAEFNAATRVVTLVPRAFRLTTPVRLVLNSKTLVDLFKQQLDGNRDGKPGGDAIALISRTSVTLQSLARKIR